MEKNGHKDNGKSRVKVLLEPLYIKSDEVICMYHSNGKLREICLPAEELKKAYSINGKSILTVELTIEKVDDGMVLCKMDGYDRKLILSELDLEFIG